MKKIYTIPIAVALAALSAIYSRGQDLPVLPDDSRISKGTLPDGISYYIVSNNTGKGFADISVICKTPHPDSSAATWRDMEKEAREFLAGSPLFENGSPESVLRRNGVSGRGNGYIEADKDAVIFRMGNVNLARGTDVTDSLLLIAVDMIRHKNKVLEAYGTANPGEAIIIAGDIDKNAVHEKLKMLSMFIPKTERAEAKREYPASNGMPARYETIRNPESETVTIKAGYRLPRIPDEYMRTVLPVVNGRLGTELGMIITKRLRTALYEERIPVADISYSFRGSDAGYGDENYSVSITTSPEYAERTVSSIASVLRDLSSWGVSKNEYAETRAIANLNEERDAGNAIKSNGLLSDRVAASYLYGASLASKADRHKFFEKSALADSAGRRFFNKFAASLIDSTANLTLSIASDSAVLSDSQMRKTFSETWNSPSSGMKSYAANLNDTSGFLPFSGKVKVKKTRKDPISGGTLWTFSNGMNVVYKKMPAAGHFRYELMIRGGFGSVRDLKAGQGAYFSDMLGLFDVCGIKHDAFMALLAAKGIEMKTSVNVSDMTLSGSAPSSSMEFLLKALAGIAGGRTPDKSAFEYYLECERLRLQAAEGTSASRHAAIDSIMYPEFNYSSFKSAKGLTRDLQEVAGSFFTNRFSMADDGVLSIIGEFDEFELKKLLQKYLGSFQTGNKRMPRMSSGCKAISGESTYMIEGQRKSVDLAMSAETSLNATTYMAAQIAAMAIRDRILFSMEGHAAEITVKDSYMNVPTERFNLMITVEERDTSSFCAGTTPMKTVKTLHTLRRAVSSLAETALSGKELGIYKNTLKNIYDSRQADPAYWTSTISRRISDGKDLHTGYKEKIDAVTDVQVRDIIRLLEESGKVEYLVRPQRKNL